MSPKRRHYLICQFVDCRKGYWAERSTSRYCATRCRIDAWRDRMVLEVEGRQRKRYTKKGYRAVGRLAKGDGRQLAETVRSRG